MVGWNDVDGDNADEMLTGRVAMAMRENGDELVSVMEVVAVNNGRQCRMQRPIKCVTNKSRDRENKG